MGQELTKPGEDLDSYGPMMQALTQLERNYVNAFLEHPTYSATALAKIAGYTDNPNHPQQIRVAGSLVSRNERVIAAINEEGSKRLRSGGAIAVEALLTILRNPSHKDHMKAIDMTLNRTGFHAMSEHKVTVDDKRPQTKQEMIDRVKALAHELGLGADAVKKMTGEDVIEAEFVEVDETDASIAEQMEDL